MPFEHETKFILRPTVTPEALNAKANLTLVEASRIEQVYMDDGVRLRARKRLEGAWLRNNHLLSGSFFMTYKRRVADGPLEIETRIDASDYHRLAPLGERSLTKERYEFEEDGTGLTLELDIFRLGGPNPTLVMMEVEHDAGEIMRLDMIESMLGPDLVLRVDPKDNRYSNYKLADPYYLLGLSAWTYGPARGTPIETQPIAA